MTHRRQSRLYKGSESDTRFNLLLEGTGLRSEDMIGALRDYLVRGIDRKSACALNNISNTSNFERDLGKLEKFADLVERIKEHDY